MTLKSARDLQKENSEQKTIYFWGLNNYLQCGEFSDEEQVYWLFYRSNLNFPLD